MEANAVTYEASELKTSNLSIPKLVRKWFEIEKPVQVGPDDLVGIGVLGGGLTAPEIARTIKQSLWYLG